MAAAEQLITENLDIWTSAVQAKSAAGRGKGNKLELYGIKKLRELILELATNGLLVETDLDGADAYKKVSDIADLVMGQAPPGSECNKTGDGTIFVKTGEFGLLYPEVIEWTTKPLKFAKKGDVLICVVGATVGKLNLGIDCAIGRSVAAIRPKEGIETKFLYYSLMPFTIKIRAKSKGSAQGVIGKAVLNAVELRIPQPEEQNRIVAKVDELMALCDQLEQQQETSITAHQTLVQTLLDALTTASERDGFTAAWARIADHFDTLFTSEWSIDQLKQAILQLAVMGKLVPQDPNDEPASELLKKIAAEKAQLVRGGKVKKQKALPPIEEHEKPFELPMGWTFVRLGETHDVTSSKRIHAKDYCETGVPFLRSKEIGELGRGEEVSTELYISRDQYLKLVNMPGFPNKGDFMLASIGGSIGNNWLCDEREFYYKDGNITKIGNHKHADMHYLKKFMESNLFWSQVTSGVSGSAYNALTIIKIKNLVFPLPPLSEQHRIVAKVAELLDLCDTLKSGLNTAQTTQSRLADVMAERAVA